MTELVLTAPESREPWPQRKPRFKSAGSEHWRTPADLYAALDREFNFTLDPAPLGGGTDGLRQSWTGHRVYCNPPYGPNVGQWLAKAREALLSVFLVAARTDTKWWHDFALGADEIRFIRGRLRFNGSRRHTAPFPSVVLVYRAEGVQ